MSKIVTDMTLAVVFVPVFFVVVMKLVRKRHKAN